MRNADSDGFTRLSMNSVDIKESRKILVRSKFVIIFLVRCSHARIGLCHRYLDVAQKANFK